MYDNHDEEDETESCVEKENRSNCKRTKVRHDESVTGEFKQVGKSSNHFINILCLNYIPFRTHTTVSFAVGHYHYKKRYKYSYNSN